MAENNWGTQGNTWDFDLDVKDGRFEVSKFDAVQFVLSGFHHELPQKGDEFPIFLGAGKAGFEVVDGGKAIEPLPGTKKIHGNSKYGRFIDSFATVAPAELMEGRDPFKADCFIGLTLSIHQDEETYTMNGEKQTGRVYTVTGVRLTDAPKKKGRAAAAAKAETTEAGDVDESAIPASTLTVITALAQTKGTHEEWVDAVYENVDGLLNTPYENEAVSEETYLRLKG